MNILHYIAGPLIGAVIGYFTNYIAVKMLFVPRREVRIFGKRLPFTPGAIPKGKDRLAKAVGKTVSDNLLSKEDMEKRLLSPGALAMVRTAVSDVLGGTIESNVTPLLPLGVTYQDARERTIDAVSMAMEKAVCDMDVGNMVASHIMIYLKEKKERKPLQSFIIESLAPGIAEAINDYCDDHAYEIVEEQIRLRADKMRGQSLEDILGEAEVEKELIINGVVSAYENIVRNSLEQILKRFDVAGMVEKKISDMSAKELEQLVLSVMKTELNMIVSLGAVIGFVLGLVMLFVS